MELCNINTIRSLLEPRGFRFSKSMGQNFLIAPWVPERIAEESGADDSCGVLEVGPGVGCLTRELSFRAGKVCSVELDKRLLPVLEETLGDRENVTIIPGDIMKTDIEALVKERFSGLTPCLCANLPYNITSPVLTKILDTGLFKTVTVMIQKEVARRICAEPGTDDYGAFTVYCQYHTVPRILFDVSPGCFEPKPKVTSAVIRMDVRETPPVDCDRDKFFRIVRAAFNQRRKTLQNALSAGLGDKTRDDIAAAIERAGLDPAIRGERLGLEEFAAVTRALYPEG